MYSIRKNSSVYNLEHIDRETHTLWLIYLFVIFTYNAVFFEYDTFRKITIPTYGCVDILIACSGWGTVIDIFFMFEKKFASVYSTGLVYLILFVIFIRWHKMKENIFDLLILVLCLALLVSIYYTPKTYEIFYTGPMVELGIGFYLLIVICLLLLSFTIVDMIKHTGNLRDKSKNIITRTMILRVFQGRHPIKCIL